MAVAATAPVHRLSVEDVLAMVAAGILDEDARVELREGVLVDLNPIGAEHGKTLRFLNKFFVTSVPEELEVAVQDMLVTVDDGFVLPDLSVIDATRREDLPAAAHLVIEVAQSSQARDREKAATYAAIGVTEYWIVDLVDEVVTVHREPSGGAYASVVERREGELESLLEGVPPVPVARLFGR